MPAPPPIVFGPSFASKHQRKPMDFTENWGEGEMFAWYGRRRERSPISVALTQLQVRIDKGGAVPHRFVLASMKDGSRIRFDRRPETGKIGALVSETLGPSKYRKAGDDYCTLSETEVENIEKSTQCEIKFNLPDDTDLLLVLSAAFAIANDGDLRNYNLATFNCFFFSWTIVMIVVRHAIPFTVPPPEKVISRLDPAVAKLTAPLTRKIVDALLSLVLDTITTFRIKTGRSLNKGLSKRELMIWGLPTNTVRLLLKGCLKMRLNFGLEVHLEKVVRGQLQSRVKPLLEQVLTNQGAANDNVKNQLWFDHLRAAFGPPVRKELLKIVWTAILETLKSGYEDMKTEHLSDNIADNPKIHILYRLKYQLLGENVAQFTRVWNEALHHALPAASKILQQEDANISESDIDSPEAEIALHKKMFNGAFKNASDAALEAAKQVVGEPESASNISERHKMWKKVWEVWPAVWDSAQDKAEEMVVDLIRETMSEIVDMVAMEVVVAVGDSPIPVDAVAYPGPGKSQKKDTPLSLSSLSVFQTRIAEHVRSARDRRKQAETHIKDIQDAMTRAWIKSKDTYQPWPIKTEPPM
ncbi:unnamed protein product [Rhizoctonia solani]|uniref:Uncharacterized protein n=1 Tax=Rhizoctonia solani TaxID=456999 RepID=A0A8H2WYM1_9AGAM|nr:unnamed protein product [Rhizoctonia solani]CAE6411400.1 unnamed protein product [Rhizoctonia solani]